MQMSERSLQELVGQILDGNIRAIAKAISLVENGLAIRQKEELIDSLYNRCGNAAIWGVTGPSGVGKSTLLDKLLEHLRRENHKVAVIVVDPSSPFSGGALLGDRLRMQRYATDDQVFIRSMASRGHLGGIAGATSDAVKIFDAAGYDTIIIETIGIGQSEIEIVKLADVVLLVLVPGLGDEIQALKAGMMEIADIFIINKSDLDGADRLQAELEYVLNLKRENKPDPEHPLVMTCATNNKGIDELYGRTSHYFATITQNGVLTSKRRNRLEHEIRAMAIAKIREKIDFNSRLEAQLDGWINEILLKKASPYKLINQKINGLIKEMKHR
jgi:LAO/AO transport system kinase